MDTRDTWVLSRRLVACGFSALLCVCFVRFSPLRAQENVLEHREDVLQENATQIPTIRIGVVDLQEVLRSSISLQTLSERLGSQRRTLEREKRDEQRKIRREDQVLHASRSDLSQEAYEERLESLRSRANELQSTFQLRTRSINEAFNLAQAKLRARAEELILTMAEERNLQLVIAKPATFLVDPRLDLTPHLIEQLNAELPELQDADDVVPSPPRSEDTSEYPDVGADNGAVHRT